MKAFTFLARRFVAEHELAFPVIVDRNGELARRLKPAHVPEAFVLDGEGNLRYRGRIDDTYPELGRRRLEATDDTLADAVNAVLDGNPVAQPQTEAVGCFYETLPDDAREGAQFTYARDVAFGKSGSGRRVPSTYSSSSCASSICASAGGRNATWISALRPPLGWRPTSVAARG